MANTKSKDHEFRIYKYISDVLKDLDWDIRNPSNGGDVYTQSEFVDHNEELKNSLKRKKPENIIRIPWEGGYRYWMIEAKRDHNDIGKATTEAKKYAEMVNNYLGENLAPFATGIAGSADDSFIVSTSYNNGKKWSEVLINNHKTTGFLSKIQCLEILANNSNEIAQFDHDPDRFLKKANAINQSFHDNSIAVSDRAKVMGALLLALANDANIRVNPDPKMTIQEVNNNIETMLRIHGKSDFFDTIKLYMPATEKNHKLFRKAIVDVIGHLRAMNVRSAINSGDDALGKFYETFLKYANGAKEMGIVLTPRHITKLAVEALNITPKDRVFDPTCGTGGFLVSAMDHVREHFKNFETFKKNGIWGIEREDPVYGLALVNMIFRGDGKSGLQDGSCFDHEFWEDKNGNGFVCLKEDKQPVSATRLFTRVLMNPPFKRETKETEFVDYAFGQCKPRALLFAVLPHVVIGGKNFHNWRINTLKRHTLKAVIKFVPKLFYPVMARTYGLIFDVHRPHDYDSDKVFMSFLFDDNSHPRPSKMKAEYSKYDNVENTTEALKNFLINNESVKNIPRERTVTKLRLNSKDLGLIEPQTYIKNSRPKIHPNITQRVSDLFNAIYLSNVQKPSEITKGVKKFLIGDFIANEVVPPLDGIKNYPDGNIPVVSATAYNNGIAKWKKIPKEKILSNLMSISKTHEGEKACQAFWHPYQFSAIGTVHLVEVVSDFSRDIDYMLYLSQQISDSNWWRFDYARGSKLAEIEVYLPVSSDGSVDFVEIKKSVQSMHSLDWNKIEF